MSKINGKTEDWRRLYHWTTHTNRNMIGLVLLLEGLSIFTTETPVYLDISFPPSIPDSNPLQFLKISP
jgi:hypothetical protein